MLPEAFAREIIQERGLLLTMLLVLVDCQCSLYSFSSHFGPNEVDLLLGFLTLIERKDSKVRRASIWNVLQQRIETRWPHFTVTVARLSAMSVQQQMQLFHGSDVVVGVHGAGLANVVWCDVTRDTRVVEIVPINPPQVRHLFWHMSSSLGLKYYPYHVMSSWNDSLMEIDVDGLEKRLVEVVNDE